MSIHPLADRGEKFRNANGVARKTGDIATARPGYAGLPTHGGRRDKQVIARFLAEPDVIHAMAEAIRASVAIGEPADFPHDVGYEGESQMEGRYLLRWHAYRKANPALRPRKTNSVIAASGKLACEVCSFDFAQTSGARGHGYIECHLVEPLHIGGEGRRTIRDLALLLREVVRRQADGLGS